MTSTELCTDCTVVQTSGYFSSCFCFPLTIKSFSLTKLLLMDHFPVIFWNYSLETPRDGCCSVTIPVDQLFWRHSEQHVFSKKLCHVQSIDRDSGVKVPKYLHSCHSDSRDSQKVAKRLKMSVRSERSSRSLFTIMVHFSFSS